MAVSKDAGSEFESGDNKGTVENNIENKQIAIVRKQKAVVTSKTHGKGKIIQRKVGSGRICLPPAK